MKKQDAVYILVFGVLLGALILLTCLPETDPKGTQPSTAPSATAATPAATAPSITTVPTVSTTAPSEPTTAPTEPTTVPTESTTAPTAPSIAYIVPDAYPEIDTFGTSIQAPVLPIPAESASSEEWTSFFYGLFHTFGSWYNMALTVEYQNPKEIHLGEFFFNGTRLGHLPFTEQEKEFRDTLGKNPNIECRRMPVPEINGILDIYFGTELSQYDMSQYEYFYYFEQTNAYYFWNTGANYAEVLGIVDYEISDNGIYRVRYVKEAISQGEVLAEVVLRRVDGYFQVLSNQIVE